MSQPPIQVAGSGPYNSKIVLCGEAPAGHEVKNGIPFCGPSGDILWDLMDEFGIHRDDVYTTNVVKIRCPNDSIKFIKQTGYSIEDYLPLLWTELNAIKPNVILALGNTALAALTRVIPLTGTGILKYRGSILPSDPYGYKTIPTLHPATFLERKKGAKEFFSHKQIQYMRFDINKMLEQSKFPEIKLPPRQLHIARTAWQLEQFFRKYAGSGLPVKVDIETFKAIPCVIAFSFNPYEGISVPLVNLLTPKGKMEVPLSERAGMLKIVVRILGDPSIPKVGHNWYNFDREVLNRWGIKTKNLWFDTILGASVVYPELDKKLGVQNSIYSDEPYFKNEGKEYNPKKDAPDKWLNYCTKDTISTGEVQEGQLKDMEDIGVKDFFFNFIMKLPELYEGIEDVGLKVDFNQRKKLDDKYSDEVKRITEELSSIAGRKFNFNSPKQVESFLFGDLGCPQRADTKDETLTALQLNVLSKSEARWKTAIRAIDLILDGRKNHKTLHTYVRAEPIDGRMYTKYNLTKETGRTSTKILEPPLTHRKFGISLHSLTKHSEIGADVRSMFVPDSDDEEFFEVDQSQAEARIVLLLANEMLTLASFDLIDIHVLTGSWFKNCTYEELAALKTEDKEEFTKWRQLGKRGRHGGGYDMGVGRLAQLLKVREKRAKFLLDRFHEFTPGIRNIFHKGIQEALLNNDCCLITPFGRFRKFYEKWGEKMWKEAYAHIPQSTIADNTKRCMLHVKEERPNLKIAIESHDGFTAIINKSERQKIAERAKYHMEQPIDFRTCSLPRDPIIIPVEFKVYEKNLEKGVDYKIPA